MALTGPQLVRSEGILPDDIGDEKILPFIEKASMELQRLLSDYSELETDVQSSQPQVKSKECQKAESLLALSYAVMGLGLRFDTAGGIVTAIGFHDGKNDLLRPEEVKKISKEYRSQAYIILAPYIQPDDNLDGIPDSVEGPISWYVI